MDATEIVNQYYDAWINRAGDMTDVPLAADFTFRGPVASFEDVAGYRQMAAPRACRVVRRAAGPVRTGPPLADTHGLS